MKTPKSKETKANEPEYFAAKPNPMFPEWLTAMLSFVRYPVAVPCAHCGRRSRHHWTLGVPFKVMIPELAALMDGPVVHRQGTPVCRAHIITPALMRPTEDAEPNEAETLLEAMNEPERELSVRGPAGYAFPLAGKWMTVDDIKADPAKRTWVAGHCSLKHALNCISAKIPARKPSQK